MILPECSPIASRSPSEPMPAGTLAGPREGMVVMGEEVVSGNGRLRPSRPLVHIMGKSARYRRAEELLGYAGNRHFSNILNKELNRTVN